MHGYLRSQILLKLRKRSRAIARRGEGRNSTENVNDELLSPENDRRTREGKRDRR